MNKVLNFFPKGKVNNKQPALDALLGAVNEIESGMYGDNPQVLVTIAKGDSQTYHTSYKSNGTVSTILSLLEIVKYRILNEHVGTHKDKS